MYQMFLVANIYVHTCNAQKKRKKERKGKNTELKNMFLFFFFLPVSYYLKYTFYVPLNAL